MPRKKYYKPRPKPGRLNYDPVVEHMTREQQEWMAADMFKLVRESFRLSYPALAHILGVARETVIRWEKRQMTIQQPKVLILALTHLMEQPKTEPAPEPPKVERPRIEKPTAVTQKVVPTFELPKILPALDGWDD